jgi:type II secretory pathway pseudopilin PulG
MRLSCLNEKLGGFAASEAALSLVELLMAVFVMSVIFLALFAGISVSFNLLQMARENLRATQVIVSRMEGLRLVAWGSDQLFNTNIVPTTFTDSFYPPGFGSTNDDGTIYHGTMTITTNPVLSPAASYSSNLAMVTVTVTWTNGGYGMINSHTRSMTTYVAKYGMQNYVYNQ